MSKPKSEVAELVQEVAALSTHTQFDAIKTDGANAKKVVDLNIRELQAHPYQNYIYSTVVDAEFLASVCEHGVLTPIHVIATSDLEDEKLWENVEAKIPYIIVSGHRRWSAAKEAGLTTIPAIITKVSGFEESQLLLHAYNFQREKTEQERIKEFISVTQVVAEINARRMKLGGYANTYFEDEDIKKTLESLSPGFGCENLDWARTSVLVQKITGYSERQQKYLRLIFDVQMIDEMQNETENDLSELYDLQKECQDLVMSGEMTRAEAYDRLTALMSELAPEPEQDAKPLQKKAKSKTKEDPRDSVARVENDEWEGTLFAQYLSDKKKDDWAEKYRYEHAFNSNSPFGMCHTEKTSNYNWLPAVLTKKGVVVFSWEQLQEFAEQLEKKGA